jgi:2-keto-4-pentenoate hydratase/2-oxohepta-3-ene-1,7-dioic acid hydratase in catechol pathway
MCFLIHKTRNIDLFCRKKVIAIGKNYEAHAREMGAANAPKEPVIFLKPTTSYIQAGESVLIPPGVGSVHHEIELGIVIGKTGRDIDEKDWEEHVAGYVLAIDMTARDLQVYTLSLIATNYVYASSPKRRQKLKRKVFHGLLQSATTLSYPSVTLCPRRKSLCLMI